MFGNRAIYNNGWIACTTPPEAPWFMGLKAMPDVVDGYKWELYNIERDFSESNDLASKMPDKLKELQELFLVEATQHNVLPLDNDVLKRILTPKPSYNAGRDEFVYTGEITGLPECAAPNILAKSYTITAELDVPAEANGMIVTQGGRFGGYGLYLLKGKPVFTYNMLSLEFYRWEADTAIASGKHTLVFDFQYDGPGLGKGGTGALKVDGKEVAVKTIPRTCPAIMNLDETFDIGSDTRTAVDERDYQVPFRFDGKIGRLTVKLGSSQVTEADRKKLGEIKSAANN
jgi:arylsulfatase